MTKCVRHPQLTAITKKYLIVVGLAAFSLYKDESIYSTHGRLMLMLGAHAHANTKILSPLSLYHHYVRVYGYTSDHSWITRLARERLYRDTPEHE
ncbi:hypothetical protein J6590_021006 [Homalodisca vitripennis]|nr:hypothetical protein J6590_021006 [Homalodisca vitripennis]